MKCLERSLGVGLAETIEGMKGEGNKRCRMVVFMVGLSTSPLRR